MTFTQEHLMNQNQMTDADPMRSYGPPQPENGLKTTINPQPGVATAIDHLEFAQSAVEDAVRGLMDRLGPILQPDEPTDVMKPGGGGTSGRPESEVARIIHDHAERLEIFASHVRSVAARVDV